MPEGLNRINFPWIVFHRTHLKLKEILSYRDVSLLVFFKSEVVVLDICDTLYQVSENIYVVPVRLIVEFDMIFSKTVSFVLFRLLL